VRGEPSLAHKIRLRSDRYDDEEGECIIGCVHFTVGNPEADAGLDDWVWKTQSVIQRSFIHKGGEE